MGGFVFSEDIFMENNEKVLLVGANVNDNQDFLNSMIELASLADALDLEVINSISQNVKDITGNFYIGSGKVKEIRTYLKDHNEINLVIFNNELTFSSLSKDNKLIIGNPLDCLLNSGIS